MRALAPVNTALAAWLVLASVVSAAPRPRDIVQSAVTRVVAVLREADAGRAGGTALAREMAERPRAEISRIAGELFDVPEMARRIVPEAWPDRSAAEQAEFVGLLTGLLERAYVGRLTRSAREPIVYVGSAVDGTDATVRSRIEEAPTHVALDYRLHWTDGRWRVYDVLVDGVSFVAVHRAAFARGRPPSSLAGLMERVQQKR